MSKNEKKNVKTNEIEKKGTSIVNDKVVNEIAKDQAFEYIKGISEDEFLSFTAVISRSLLWAKAQNSNEFELAVEKLNKRLENGDLKDSDFMKKLLYEGDSTLNDRKNCIENTCLEISYLLKEIIDKWESSSDKKDVTINLYNVYCRLNKLEFIIKCLEKYFISIDNVEEYVNVRIQLKDFIRMIDGITEIFE